MVDAKSDLTGDEWRALELAKQVGFRVHPSGYVHASSVADNLQAMLIQLVFLAQADRLDNDGK